MDFGLGELSLHARALSELAAATGWAIPEAAAKASPLKTSAISPVAPAGVEPARLLGRGI